MGAMSNRLSGPLYPIPGSNALVDDVYHPLSAIVQNSVGVPRICYNEREAGLEIEKKNHFVFAPHITAIDFQYSSVKRGPESARFISEAMKANNTVTFLDLTTMHIESEGARFISEVLKVNNTLTCLNLDSNSIGAEGARFISDALKVNNTLTLLNLTSNKIGSEGAKFIAEALQVNRTLTSLGLGSRAGYQSRSPNDIGAEGARFIAEALKANNTLTSLDLGNSKIGAQGAIYICEALKVNGTLTSLNLASKWLSTLNSFLQLTASATRALEWSVKH
eukprot:TRINITY_DN4937_c0_g1_i2.p1 TRINITY_DN4937_c0_g1~~TRINITY_DN4937_c0_g1_i2.p1  ORF type:complete len:278 (-),score=15.57 TRINITY_DN4937_c0_g1_i2:155-988(-)